ncbi:MAG: PKD domain-containing protein [Crocinitomicaceae bacterium]
MLKLEQLFLWFISAFFCISSGLGFGQVLVNPGLDSPITISSTPPSWSAVPFTDGASHASGALQTFPDVVGLTGPGVSAGVIGNPHSGNSFVSGLLAQLSPASIYHEGIQQTVTGLNTLVSYQLGFYQTVVKQDNCLDTSGRWAVYMDNVLLTTSTISTSHLPFNSNNLVWELDTFTFIPTATTHTFKFLPVDDDADWQLSSTNLAGSLRMGIDSVYIIPLIDCNETLHIGNDTLLCLGDSLTLSIDNFPDFNYLWSNGDTDSLTTLYGAGVYSVQIDSSVCSYKDTIIITNPAISILGNDTIICSSDSILLDATTPNATYLWNNLSADSTLLAFSSGQYYVNITANGCQYSDSIQIDYHVAPNFDLGNDTTLCEGASLLVDALTPASTYLWYDASTNSDNTVSQADTVSLILTQNTCHYYDTIVIDYHVALTHFAGNDTIFCTGDSITIGPNISNPSYLWSNGSIDSATTFYVADTVWLTVSQNGCNYTDSVIITNYPSINFVLGNDTTICPGDSILIDATTPNATYLWNDLSIDTALIAFSSGQYYADITVNGCQYTDSIQIDYFTVPSLNLGNDTTLCEGASLYIDALTPASTYLWNDASINSDITILEADTVSIILTQNTCHYYDTIVVDYYAPVTQFLGNDTIFCTGDSITIGPNISSPSYLWSNGSIDSATTFYLADTVWLVISQNGCNYKDSAIITNYPVISFALGNDTTICSSDSILLDATTPNATYLWNDLSVDTTLLAFTAGQYYVDVNINGCLYSDSIQISHITSPHFDLGNDTTLCEGASLYIDALTPASTYLWNDASINSNITITEADTISLILTQNTCHYYDTIVVDYYAPVTQFLGNDTIFCTGDSITIGPNISSPSYLWSNGSIDSATTFYVADTVWLMISQNGCNYMDSAIITNYPVISFALGNDTTICSSDSILLDATTPNATYLWNDLSVDTALMALNSGQYYVDITVNGCKYSDSIQVDYIAIPNFDLGNDTTLCQGASLYIDALTPASAYQWNDASTNSDITISGADTVSLILTQYTCNYYDTIVVNYTSTFKPNLGNDTTLCPQDSIILLVPNNYGTILWSNASQDSSLAVKNSGLVWVELNNDGCLTYDTVDINYFNSPIINLGNDTILCVNENITWNIYQQNASYLWSDNSTNADFTASSGGLYYVEMIDSNTCKAFDTIQVSETYLYLDLGSDLLLCDGDSAQLNAYQQINANYHWQNNSNTSSIYVSTSGDYWVNVTAAHCQISDTINIDFIELTPSFMSSQSFCEQAPTDFANLSMISSNDSIQSYYWNFGNDDDSEAESPTYQYPLEGIYDVSLTISSYNGCESTLRKKNFVTIYKKPNAQFTTELVDPNAIESQYLLNSNNTEATFWTWTVDGEIISNDQNTSHIYEQYAEGYSHISLTVVTDFGCTDSISKYIELHENTIFYVPNAFTPFNQGSLNNTFKPIFTSGFIEDTYQLLIFNRWGEVLFESLDYENGWDGTYSGQVVPMAAYVWQIRYQEKSNSQVVTISGTVTIIK